MHKLLLVLVAVLVAAPVASAAPGDNFCPGAQEDVIEWVCLELNQTYRGEYVDNSDGGCTYTVTIDFGNGESASARVEPTGSFHYTYRYEQPGIYQLVTRYRDGSGTNPMGGPCSDGDVPEYDVLVQARNDRFAGPVLRVEKARKAIVQRIPVPASADSYVVERVPLRIFATKRTRYVGFKRFAAIKKDVRVRVKAQYRNNRWTARKIVRL